MDIAWVQSMTIEAGLDQQSRGAVAQGDIKTFYCNLQPLLVYEWLIDHGCSEALSATFIRFQLCPSMRIAVAGKNVELTPRSIRVFTGCTCSVQAGRIPLLDASHMLHGSWKQHGYKFESSDNKQRCMGVSSFVDNVFCSSHQADSAVYILDELEDYLVNKWMLVFNGDSKLVRQHTSTFPTDPLPCAWIPPLVPSPFASTPD